MQTILRINDSLYSFTDDWDKKLNVILKKKNNINFFVLQSTNIKKKTKKFYKKSNLWEYLLWYYKTTNNNLQVYNEKRILSMFLYQDMINLNTIWRRLRNYPVRGQRTWSNGKNANINSKLLLNFRLKQFFIAYGGKKRINFSTLINAEYTNKFWMRFFTAEWLQARKNLRKYVHKKTKNLQIDLINLSKQITAGYKRKGNAAKLGKAKKTIKSATIGLPILFSRYMYSHVTNRKFPYKINVEQQQKKMTGIKKTKKIIKKTKKKQK